MGRTLARPRPSGERVLVPARRLCPVEAKGGFRRRFDGLVAAMRRHRDRAGALAPGIDRFTKVTRSYRPGLFHCCAVPGLPRTNNGLEQLFGSQR